MVDAAAVTVREARDDELEALAALRWRWVRESTDEALPDLGAYVVEVAGWARQHRGSHVPFAAVEAGEVVGMAWLAIQARVPSPRALERRSGDLQSCYVVPDARGRGIGTMLADAVLASARERGLEHVTVHASPRSIPVYERAGFRSNPRALWAEGAIGER
ncbi:Ribosomal protein S18 acetylase RimI [Agrococcus baldri]|uniref:Ribosomal protein S18 acetylase RimI n=1 Tax=Agrococcus baldri TaxID=153730 RepID=A0AA94KYA8_9MICO|nr:GNAT family N-acetyltransferase [Agrococcus baldri]SFR97096.1 Ribosomal protein S18 acetylase RimI [Agrococcus baldri]